MWKVRFASLLTDWSIQVIVIFRKPVVIDARFFYL